MTNPTNKYELLQCVNECSFMVDEIALYLDTHPNCEDAIEAYNHFKKLRCEAVAEYVQHVGPLCKYDVDVCKKWSWNKGPWPWEGACGC